MVEKIIHPKKEQCLQYFEDYSVPYNIKDHCVKVSKIAKFLAEELKEQGVEIDVILCESLGLVHDLFKVAVLDELRSFKDHPEKHTNKEIEMHKKLRQQFQGKHESEIAYDVFKDKFPKFAKIILQSGNAIEKKKSFEEKIVHYVDWRVSQETICSLDARLKYLSERYERKATFWQEATIEIKKIERELFDIITFEPEELKEKFKAAGKE